MLYTSSVVSIKNRKTTWYLSGKWKLSEKNIPSLEYTLSLKQIGCSNEFHAVNEN